MSSLKPIKEKTRKRSPKTERALYAYAGGRCEFKGCGQFLLRHPISLRDGNFAEKAHIRPFSEGGPRGEYGDRSDIDDVSNLMLLCGVCHGEIDSSPEQYPVGTLKQFKAEHEARIHHLTSLGPEFKTKVLAMRANIAGKKTSASDGHIFNALFPNLWPSKKPVDTIDLTKVLDLSGEYTLPARTIQDFVRGFYTDEPDHVSVFGIGPIALLIELGSQLSDKITTDFYQLHRDTKDWKWKEEAPTAVYSTVKIRGGEDHGKVGLVLSLSGPIQINDVTVHQSHALYEIKLSSADPNPGFLRTRADLQSFREEYKRCIDLIVNENPGVKEIHLYPAIPAPVAIICGHDLLSKAHPSLVVHDFDKKLGFKEVHRIN